VAAAKNTNIAAARSNERRPPGRRRHRIGRRRQIVIEPNMPSVALLETEVSASRIFAIDEPGKIIEQSSHLRPGVVSCPVFHRIIRFDQCLRLTPLRLGVRRSFGELALTDGRNREKSGSKLHKRIAKFTLDGSVFSSLVGSSSRTRTTTSTSTKNLAKIPRSAFRNPHFPHWKSVAPDARVLPYSKGRPDQGISEWR
jgi:hypothetical protein